MKKYLTFNPAEGYPVGKNICYECVQCGDSIPSVPDDSQCCTCGNICTDIDAGRVSVRDDEMLKAFRV